MKSSIHADLDAFHSGFQACAKEVLQYLSQFENWTAREQRCAQLIGHLHKVLAQFQAGAQPPQHQLAAGDARQDGQRADGQANCVPVIQRTQGGELNENDTDTDSGYGGEAEKGDGKDKECARDKAQGPKAVKIKQEFGDERAAKKPKMTWSGSGLGAADATRPQALMNSLMGISGVGQQTPICMPFYFINPSAAASYMPLFDKGNIDKYMYPACPRTLARRRRATTPPPRTETALTTRRRATSATRVSRATTTAKAKATRPRRTSAPPATTSPLVTRASPPASTALCAFC